MSTTKLSKRQSIGWDAAIEDAKKRILSYAQFQYRVTCTSSAVAWQVQEWLEERQNADSRKEYRHLPDYKNRWRANRLQAHHLSSGAVRFSHIAATCRKSTYFLPPTPSGLSSQSYGQKERTPANHVSLGAEF